RSWCWCRSYRLVVYEYAAVDCVGDVDIAAGIRPHIQGTPQAAGAHAAVIRSAGSEAAELSKHQISSIVVKRSVVFEHAVIAVVRYVEVAVGVHTDSEGEIEAISTCPAIIARIRDKIRLTEHQISSIIGEGSVVFEHAAVGPIGDEEIAARIHRQTAGLAQAGRTQTAIVAAMRCEAAALAEHHRRGSTIREGR